MNLKNFPLRKQLLLKGNRETIVIAEDTCIFWDFCVEKWKTVFFLYWRGRKANKTFPRQTYGNRMTGWKLGQNFNNICLQRMSDTKLVNKCISQVENQSGIISFKWASVQSQTLVSFVLHTVCLYTCWAGHLAQRIRMLTSLHSAHSFWNDSIFLILFSFRVCGFEAIWHPFSIVDPLRTFAYLNFVLKFRTGFCFAALWKAQTKKQCWVNLEA